MNRTIQLLDCTLRDGGYINDWEFGHDNIFNIFERVVNAGVEVIEIGFLDDRRNFDINRTIMPGTACVEKIFGGLDRKQAMVVGMIDYGTCDISKIQPCEESWLDGIRVIFKKEKMYPAMEYCRQVKALGYKVFSQLVSVASYNDKELKEVIRLVNDVSPYAVSMVDTYGLLDPDALKHIIKVIDDDLNPNIVLGFHAHNNFQLGFINTATVLEYDMKRNILVDGTLYGMGKSAGNAPLELIAMHMNDRYGKNYVITEMQEAITSSVMDFQKRSPWGYQLFYYIAAANKVHPNYVSYLLNKRTLSITAVNEILSRLPEDEKLGKNMRLIEQLYLDYQKNECDDSRALKELGQALNGHKILIVGPAPSVGTHLNTILAFIEQNDPIIITINYIPSEIHPHYLFLTNSNRYLQATTKLHEAKNASIKLIASSNLMRNEKNFDYIINFSDIIDEKAEFPDNSMCMLVRTLLKAGCDEIALAGLDGYTPDSVNYHDIDKEYSFLKTKADSLNQYAKDFFKIISTQMKVEFITPSLYQEDR